MDELPEEFFRDLTGGVIVSEALVIADYARNNDVFVFQTVGGARRLTKSCPIRLGIWQYWT